MISAERSDRKTVLTVLWTFAVLNYLYADVLSLMNPGRLNEFVSGVVGGMTITPLFLFFGAILIETAIVMVLLSTVLRYKWNRIANIASGLIHTLAVAASLLVGTLQLYYAFFAAIEIATTVFIVWYAWTWKE